MSVRLKEVADVLVAAERLFDLNSAREVDVAVLAVLADVACSRILNTESAPSDCAGGKAENVVVEEADTELALLFPPEDDKETDEAKAVATTVS